MSFGNMNTPVEIMKRVIETDDEGFKNERMKTVASVRAYREGRHGSERWRIWRHFPLRLICFV